MKLGYIRLSKAGPSEAEQRIALRKADVSEDRIYVDALTKRKAKPGDDQVPVRTRLIKQSARPGDVIVVSSAARFVLSLADGLAAMATLGQRGIALHVVSTGQTHEWTERDAINVQLVRGMVGEVASEITAKARAEAEKRWVNPKLEGKLLDKAKRLWADPKLTAAEVATQIKVPQRRLYRVLGPRGTPAFGKVSKL